MKDNEKTKSSTELINEKKMTDEKKLEEQKLIEIENKRLEAQKELDIHQRIMNFQFEEVEILKSKAAFGYKYAPLDVILPLIKPYLKKHGIGFFHDTYNKDCFIEGVISEKQYLRTTFFCLDDPKGGIVTCETMINDKVQLAKMNEFMVMGSAITYFRRYHIVTILGLTTDEDSDAGGGKPSENNNTNPTSKSTVSNPNPVRGGRSVETAKSEDTVDYVAIFDNVIKSKPEKTVRDMFSKYSKNMSAEISKKIIGLIDEKFKK